MQLPVLATNVVAVGECKRAFEWLFPIHVLASVMGKVIQTDLEEEEYMLFTELLHKKKLSIREGLRLAVNRMLAEEVKVDPKDPFLNRKPAGEAV